MRSLFKCAFICIIFGSLVPSLAAQPQLFVESLLGGNSNNNNNNNPNIPLIGSLGLGQNNDPQNRLKTNYNQYPNNNYQYPNNNNANRGLLSVLGVNSNVNRANTNNLTRNPSIDQKIPNNNVNDLKNQMKEAEKLLQRLKELNRLKEQQKLENENNRGEAGAGNKEPETDNSHSNNMNHNNEKTGALKSLTNNKFYFMVKPVVPENEAAKYEQTVYYVDKK